MTTASIQIRPVNKGPTRIWGVDDSRILVIYCHVLERIHGMCDEERPKQYDEQN